MRTIIVEPYNPAWPDDFDKIARELKKCLGDAAISIEHVGSTSVPGLWAKPIIDIDIIIPKNNLPIVKEKLAAIGYYHVGDNGIPGREAFDYRAPEKLHLREHHLYVCKEGSAELLRHLALRDFLRTNEEYRDKYSAIKREMAKKFPHDIDSYMDGKGPVIEEIYALSGAPLKSTL